MDYTTNTLAYEALFLAATAGDSGCLKEHKDRSTEVDTPGISLYVCLRRRCLKRVFFAFHQSWVLPISVLSWHPAWAPRCGH